MGTHLNDETALVKELVKDHYGSVYRFLYGLTRRAEDAEDLTQQSFVRAIQGIQRFDGRVPIRSWVLAIAYREFCKFRRRRPWLPLLADRPAAGDPYADLVDAQILLGALAGLPSEARGIFLLHHMEELPIPDIAEMLGVPEGTVKSRLFHVRKKLRHLLGERIAYAAETI
jgi:RNA polymerase sigma-70 factor (ECF subfamily)